MIEDKTSEEIDIGYDDDEAPEGSMASSFGNIFDNLDDGDYFDDPKSKDENKTEAEEDDDGFNLGWLDESPSPEKEKEKEEAKKPEETGEPETKEEDIDISGDDIVRKDGKPVSIETKVAFQKVKEQRNAERLRAEEAERERDALKKDLHSLDYRNTDEFKNTFDKPINDLFSQANKWIHGASVDTIPLIKQKMHNAIIAVNKGDEQEYYKIVTDVADQLSSIAGNKFASAMTAVWEKSEDRKAALADADAAAEIVKQRRLASFPNVAKSLDDVVESDFRQLSTSDPIVAFYRKDEVKDRFKYDETVPREIDAIKKDLKDFAATGVITPSLSRAILSAAHSPVRDQERKMLIASITKMNEDLTMERKKASDLQAKLEKITGRSSQRSVGRSESKTSDEDDFSYGMSSIFNND